jgi:hypothetical protein
VASTDWSAGLVHDQSVSWHALRGVDLAGLATILHEGVRPSRNSTPQGWAHEVCASGSPEMSLRNRREARSFLAYTMNDSSLSLALNVAGRWQPNGGFVDEHRIPGPVSPDSVIGLTANDGLLHTRLTAVDATLEPMKPEQAAAYIDRNLAFATHLAHRNGRAPAPAQALLDFANQSKAATATGQRLTQEETTTMHAAVMATYSAALATPQNPAPTVGDAIQAALAESARRPPVLTWSQTDKKQLQSRNAQVTALRAASYPAMGRAGERAGTGTAPASPSGIYQRRGQLHER